nr:MAG TPA: hypothetical protein [Caudoviricetes sp.]
MDTGRLTDRKCIIFVILWGKRNYSLSFLGNCEPLKGDYEKISVN